MLVACAFIIARNRKAASAAWTGCRCRAFINGQTESRSSLGGLAVTIPVLGALRENEADVFFNALFDAVDKRLRADRAPALFDEF
ncbi:hypothetical protein [Paenibacillus silvisoli]|uniref:hypothetical protein n=1 Tax=Paenibacillus silvisoli TaxID=3110539 RepID=UPI0028045E8D|nr:hypothetical protein [Paenibacillus silvisoli]